MFDFSKEGSSYSVSFHALKILQVSFDDVFFLVEIEKVLQVYFFILISVFLGYKGIVLSKSIPLLPFTNDLDALVAYSSHIEIL